MLIRVRYKNDKYDFINPARLDELLKTGSIAMFQRSNGWARVGVDPLRTAPREASHERPADGKHP